jgi:SOS-response transcriptional repressor LexA
MTNHPTTGPAAMPHEPNYLKVYRFIIAHVERHGRRPTFHEIGNHFGFGEKNAVTTHLRAIQRNGFIRYDNTGRQDTIVFLRLPDGSPFEGFRAVRKTPTRPRDGGGGPAEADTRTQSLPSR